MPKSVLRAVLGRMQFTLHTTRRTPHDASRLVQALSAWLVKTRRAPSRHSRDARMVIRLRPCTNWVHPPPSPSFPFPPLPSATCSHLLCLNSDMTIMLVRRVRKAIYGAVWDALHVELLGGGMFRILPNENGRRRRLAVKRMEREYVEAIPPGGGEVRSPVPYDK